MLLTKLVSTLSLCAAVLAAPAQQKRAVGFNWGSEKIRGVNIGGWLVLEPWITPSIFDNANRGRPQNDIVDEYTLGEKLGSQNALNILRNHWDTFVTWQDFNKIKQSGFNVVRIPIGYWAYDTFGSPYVSGAAVYIDAAIDWARSVGLKILIDLHGAPGSQNGFDNSGQRMDRPTWQQGDTVQRTLQVLRTISQKYAQKSYQDVIIGIELLNEPALYNGLSRDVLAQFYRDGYGQVREVSDTPVIISDGFTAPNSWNGFLTPSDANAQNVAIDNHQYQVFDSNLLKLSPAGHAQQACSNTGAYGGADKWTFVGEWTSAMTDCARYLNGYGRGARYDGTYLGNPKLGECGWRNDLAQWPASYKDDSRRYIEAQIRAFESTTQGWFWWNFKTEGAAEWDAFRLIDAGVFPAIRNGQVEYKFAAADYTGAERKSDPEEIALVRKIDWRLMPTLMVMYFLNYVDRNAIAQARLNNLEEDLGMTGVQFNTCVSILFVGYVLMQVPSNMLITRIKPGIYMSSWMFVWAIVSACTALVQNFGGMVACRFFLGITEAPFYPGATYMLSIFYTRREVATRIALLYCAQILATGLSGLIAAGVFQMDGLRGIAGWRWLFIIEGAVTAFVAIFGFFMLPNTPLTTRWLSPRERELAHARMERDRIGDSTDDVSMMDGLKQACRDPRTWLFCLMQNFHLSACSFNSFFPTVVKTLGFSTTITLVLTCPPFLFAGAAGIATGWSSGRMHERTWHITCGLLVAVVGFVIAASTLNTAGRYIACFIFPVGAYSVNSVIIGWASSTLSQTKEKKAVVLAMTNVGGQIGYIYGAYLWPETDKPRYGIGFGASAGFALLSILCAWIIRAMLIKENKRLRQSTNERIMLYGY
ncbi:glycoside hydrolase superfamily [Bipolaris maydis]|nr:glycoside hydrolase superfamily [Bipolaris maydis]KAJ5020814.1 glycoside hydrolase superfamily [Bipolaris maydis]KAJ5020904.1 glycoside hydrolase superfamily [Bipolaris maydis]KAJ5020942.1 glycoside hydrolase superfamily [Bipolaris maydis]KAJ5021113.1 glycoside hydrolase superfamily [Bipolaris maydis]